MKEGILQIFNALKNPSPSPGIEHRKIGHNDKHPRHYTTNDDKVLV
jgi:hypothetical protein